MNWLDLVIVLALGWFALAGLSAGILRESVTLFAALAGVVVAGLFYKQLASDFTAFNMSERNANIAAFLAIFLAIVMAGQIVALLLKRTASLLALGPIDHTAGLLFGFAKGFVLIQAALFLVASYHISAIVRAMDGSLLTPFFLNGLPVLLHLLPSEFRSAVERFPG